MLHVLILLGCGQAVVAQEEPLPKLVVEPPRPMASVAGMKVLQVDWTLGGPDIPASGQSSGTAWAVRVERPRLTVIPVSEPGTLAAIHEISPAGTTPSVVINGGFYDRGTGDPAPMGVVVHEGAVLFPVRANGGSGVLFSDPAGLHIVHRDAFSARTGGEEGVLEAVQSVDRIIDEGRTLVAPHADHRLAARSGVALAEDGTAWAIVAVADGSVTVGSDGAIQLSGTVGHGLPLWAFAELIGTLGVQTALNLDGAISTQLRVELGGVRPLLDVRGEMGTMQAVKLEAAAL